MSFSSYIIKGTGLGTIAGIITTAYELGRVNPHLINIRDAENAGKTVGSIIEMVAAIGHEVFVYVPLFAGPIVGAGGGAISYAAPRLFKIFRAAPKSIQSAVFILTGTGMASVVANKLGQKHN